MADVPSKTDYWSVLVVFFLSFFVVMAARLAISPVVPQLRDHFGVSSGVVGVALTLMWAMYALLQYPSGVLGDRFGERRVILGALALVTVSSALLALSPTFPFFVLFVTVLGASAGLYYTVATSLLTKRVSNVGRAIGIHGAGGPFAGVVAPPLVAWLVPWFGWRVGLAMGLLFGLPVLGLALFGIPRVEPGRPDQSLRAGFELDRLRGILLRPRIAYTTILAILMWFTFQASASFFPTFLIEYHSLSLGVASTLFSGYFVMVGVSMVLVGELSERVGRDAVIAVVGLLGVVGYGSLTVVDTLPAIAVAVGLCGVSMSLPTPVEARIMDGLSDDERSSVFGLVRTVFQFFGALGSTVTGAIAGATSWGLSFAVLAVVLALLFVGVVANWTLFDL